MALIHLDAGVIIGFLDREDTHHASSRSVVAGALDRGDRLAMAASALAECLVGPARRGEEAVALVHELCARLPIEIFELDAAVATVAARLRARHGVLRLPDALVIASASADHADRLVTTDRRWPAAKALDVEIAIDVI